MVIDAEFATRYSVLSIAAARRPPFAHSRATSSSPRDRRKGVRSPALPSQPRWRIAFTPLSIAADATSGSVQHKAAIRKPALEILRRRMRRDLTRAHECLL